VQKKQEDSNTLTAISHAASKLTTTKFILWASEQEKNLARKNLQEGSPEDHSGQALVLVYLDR